MPTDRMPYFAVADAHHDPVVYNGFTDEVPAHHDELPYNNVLCRAAKTVDRTL